MSYTIPAIYLPRKVGIFCYGSMRKITQFAFAALLFPIFLFTASDSQAGVRCETQYGGGEKCAATEITLNKKVRVPAQAKKVMGIKDEWIDNFLLTHTYKFAPNQEVEFQIVIANTSKQNFGQVEIRDFLPAELALVSDKTKFNFQDFKAGEKRDFYIKARVVSVDKLSSDVLCPINKAEVWTDGGTFQDSDTAQVCVEKKAAQVKAEKKVLPATGPEDWFITLAGSLALGTIGIYLVKFKKFGRG